MRSWADHPLEVRHMVRIALEKMSEMTAEADFAEALLAASEHLRAAPAMMTKRLSTGHVVGVSIPEEGDVKNAESVAVAIETTAALREFAALADGLVDNVRAALAVSPHPGAKEGVS